MRIAYVSTDEVNQNLVERIAAECGVVLCKQLPEDSSRDGLCDAVLYNLDDLPRAERSALLEGFRGGKPVHPTAVHGYDITDEQAIILSRNGVEVARRLHRGLLRSLVTAARQDRHTFRQDDAETDLTWVNLA